MYSSESLRLPSMGKNPSRRENRAEQNMFSPLTTGVLLLIILLTVVVRWGLIDVPLERDEGEYAYAGQLILQGIPPYQQMYNMKLPGIYAAYACILAILGQTHQAIHLGLLVINAATILLVFVLAQRLYGAMVGLVAAAFFAVMSLLPSVQGVFANSEHFVILPALGGLFFLLRALEEKRQGMLFVSGLLLGLSFLMKQHGAAFILFGGIYILYDQFWRRPVGWQTVLCRVGLFSLGATAPYGLTCMIFAYSGAFDKFWFWTFEYARTYTSQVPIRAGWSLFKAQSLEIIKSAPLIWLLVFIGLIAIGVDQRSRRKSAFAGMLMAFSFLAICPGFYFRPHYFILLLPASAILAGVSLGVLQERILKNRSLVIKYGCPLFLAGICVFASIYQHRNILFEMTSHQVARAVYGLNPFPEAIEVSRFVRSATEEGDRIAVLGSEPQIYFYSRRRSASGYIYMYALMEGHRHALKMQREMVTQIESARPKLLIIVNVPTSWLKTRDSHPLLMTWLQSYQAKYYTLVGLVDIDQQNSVYHWAPDVNWPPGSPAWVAVLKRKNGL